MTYFHASGLPLTSITADLRRDWPGVHTGLLRRRVLVGPDTVYAEFNAGHLPSEWIMVTDSEYGPGGGARPHTRPDHEVVYYVTSGEATFRIGDEEKSLGPGGCAWVPAGVRHAFEVERGSDRAKILAIHALERVPPSVSRRAVVEPPEDSNSPEPAATPDGPVAYTIAREDPKPSWLQHLQEIHPDTHFDAIGMWILAGPAYEFERFNLGNLDTRRIQVTESFHEPGARTLLHRHDDHEQVFVVLEGQAVIRVDGEERVVGPGEIAYIPVGVEHGYRTHGNENLRLLDIHCRPAVPGRRHLGVHGDPLP